MNNDFELDDEILFFSKSISSGIRSKNRRKSVEQEITDHMQDAVRHKMTEGMKPEKAFMSACADFGDMSTQRQSIAMANNLLPPEFGRNLLRFVIRLVSAFVFHLFFYAIITVQGIPFHWTFYIPSVLILFGLYPLKYLCSVVKNGVFYIKLLRYCNKNNCEIVKKSSVLNVILGLSDSCDVALKSGNKVILIKRMVCYRRRATLRFSDEMNIEWLSVHSNGARFVDRRPGKFNFTKTPDLSYTTYKHSAFSFLLFSDSNSDRYEKVLIIDPLPKEITYVKGSNVEYVSIGQKIYDFTLHSSKSFLSNIRSKQL